MVLVILSYFGCESDSYGLKMLLRSVPCFNYYKLLQITEMISVNLCPLTGGSGVVELGSWDAVEESSFLH